MAQNLKVVEARLKQIITPAPDSLSAKWHATDALYWLTGDESYATAADALMSEPSPPPASAEPTDAVAWMRPTGMGPEFTDDAALAGYWMRKGSTVTPLYSTLRAAPTTQEVSAEPVEYQFRTRADWLPNWSDWERCTKGQYDDYVRVPLLHDWHYEVRALYLAPTTTAPAAPGPEIAAQGALAEPDSIALAKRMYGEWTDEQGIHCNRFPAFSELSTAAQQEWIGKARIAGRPTNTGEV